MIKKSEPKAYIYFLLGAVCLLGFLAEYVMLKAEMLLYGKNYYKFTITESITHWVLICVVWGMISLVMFYIAVRCIKFSDAVTHAFLKAQISRIEFSDVLAGNTQLTQQPDLMQVSKL